MPLNRGRHRLRLLGSPLVEGGPEGASPGGIPGRILALLALLGTGGPGGRTRDKLVGLLWPEQSQTTARHSLSDVVYRVRRLLGEDVVRTDGELLSLNPDAIEIDAREFAEAIARGDLEAAIDLYRGPFLDGFHLSGSRREFESWLDRERARLALDYERAVESLAEAAEERGDPVRAVALWRRFMRHDPANSRVALRLMRALARAGDVGNALAFADEHESFLREQLDLDLPAPVREYSVTLREGAASGIGRPGPATDQDSGQVAALTEPPAPEAPTREGGVTATGAPGPAGARSDRRRRRISRRLLVPIALVLVLGSAAVVLLERGTRADGGIPQIRSLAVLPLQNLSGGPEDDLLADGMTSVLIAELGQVGGDLGKVISQTTAMRYRGVDRPLPEVARELGVDALIEGSVLRTDGTLQVTLQMVHGRGDRVLWSEVYTGDLADLLSIQRRVSRDVAARVQLTLSPGEERRLAASVPSTDPRAAEAYLKGKHHLLRWGARDAEEAVRRYEEAIRIDPGFAAAHGALAELCVMLPVLNVRSHWTTEDCEAMAGQALALDPDRYDAHTALALIHNVRWEFDAAEAEFRRAIELNPSAVSPRLWYAVFLSQMMRLEEAVAQARTAEKLDPLSVLAKSILVGALMNDHRYDEGLAKLDEAISLDPDDASVYIYQAAIYNLKGMPREGLEAAGRAAYRAGEEAGQVLVLEAWSHALMGDEEQALAIMSRARELNGEVATAGGMATVYVALGREADAIDALEVGFRGRAPWLPNVTSYPHLDALRDHPRFRAMRGEMGLD